MIARPFRKFPVVFVRLKGRNGMVREYPALISTVSEYCILPKVDAFALGYPEAANSDNPTRIPNELDFVGSNAYGRGALVKMVQVDIGQISARNVEFLTYDILQVTGFDVVLGVNILQDIKLEIDFTSHQLTLERDSNP